MNIEIFLNEWITASNAFNTTKYLDFYLKDAILDDPSVGRKFEDHDGIQEYFEDYFIGYHTETQLLKLTITDTSHAYAEVLFSGDFPERKIVGTFDFTFKNGKIAHLKAALKP